MLAWHCCQVLARDQDNVAKPEWSNGLGCIPLPPHPPSVGCRALRGLVGSGEVQPILHCLPRTQAPVSHSSELS